MELRGVFYFHPPPRRPQQPHPLVTCPSHPIPSPMHSHSLPFSFSACCRLFHFTFKSLLSHRNRFSLVLTSIYSFPHSLGPQITQFCGRPQCVKSVYFLHVPHIFNFEPPPPPPPPPASIIIISPSRPPASRPTPLPPPALKRSIIQGPRRRP